MKALLVVFAVAFASAFLLTSLPRRHATMPAPADLTEMAQLLKRKPAPARSGPGALQWADLQSADYRQYAANLRAAGTPEETIYDIPRAEVETSFAPKFAALNHPTNFVSDPSLLLRSKQRGLAQLQKEIDRILSAELGLRKPAYATSLFTAEQEERIAEARKMFPQPPGNPMSPENYEQARSNRVARVQYLSSYLSPEQLQYYKLDREGDAPRVAWLLQGMLPSKAELLSAANATDGKEITFRNGSFAPDVEAALKNALGEERFGLVKELHGAEYSEITAFARLNGLSDNTANQLVQLRLHMAEYSPEVYRDRVAAALKNPKLLGDYLQDKYIHGP